MYETFDVDDLIENEEPAYKSPLKNREKDYNDKYSKTFMKNFMHENASKEEQYNFTGENTKSGLQISGKRERRRPSRLNANNLKPHGQGERTKISTLSHLNHNFRNLKIDDDDLEIEDFSSSKQGHSPDPLNRHVKEEVAQEQIERKGPNLLIFEQEEDSEKNDQPLEQELKYQNQQHFNIRQSQIQSSKQVPAYLDIDMSSSISNAEGQNLKITSSSNYFHMKNKNLLLKEVLQTVKPSFTLKMVLIRNKSGFTSFWPQFYLKFPTEQTPVLSAKRTTARPISTFLLAFLPNNFQQNTENYVGKMKSNALGNQLYIYGPGYNPSNAREKGIRPRQMLATISYQTFFFSSGRPRQFTVYVLKEGIKYFDLVGVKMYEDEINLQQLFLKHEFNRDKIVVFRNRKPVWNEHIGGFILNFKGRVPCASIKNFILQDTFGNESMIFGRRQENEFVLQIADKISPYLAICIALSSFDSRVMCE